MSDEEKATTEGANIGANPWRSPPTGRGSDLTGRFGSGGELPGNGLGQQLDTTKSTSLVLQLLFWAAGLLAVLGCAYLLNRRSEQLVQESLGVSPAMEEEGKSYIGDLLRDPASAQFRNVKSFDTCVTGQVNGKNGFGGYAGFSDFFYDAAKKSGRLRPDAAVQDGSIAAMQGVLSDADYTNAESDCRTTALQHRTHPN